jgi:hypothetical protein
MNALTTDGRHLDREGLRQYLSAGAPAVLKIEGTPPLYLIVEAASETLRLRAPQARNTLPDVSAYRNLAAEIVHWRDAAWCQLSISGPLIFDAYSVLIAIADRMQKQGVEFAVATRAALEAFREVLAKARGLSEEAEVGLFGELLLLGHLLKTIDPASAISAWRGPSAEEHDFGLPTLDLEVKTTTSESRLHWVNSLTQLRPTLERPLYLGSLQLTAAGAGGLALADIVARTKAWTPEDLRPALCTKLSDVGWNEDGAPADARRFRFRTKPHFYAVAGEFPSLTPEKIAAADLSPSIIQLRYMIDLSNVTPAAPLPGPLATFCEEGWQ